MDEIRTIPPILTRKEWNALLNHSLVKGVSHIIFYDTDSGKWLAIDGKMGKVAVTPNADFTTVIEAAITVGAKHIYVKGTTTWIPTNNAIAGIIIEGEDRVGFKIHAVHPDADYLTLMPGCILINCSVMDKTGLDEGYSPNIDKEIFTEVNLRAETPTHVGSWNREYFNVIVGESGVDAPALAVENFGKGDAMYMGVESYGVGLNCWVNNADAGDPNSNAMGVRTLLFGRGIGYWADIKPGATTVGLMPESTLPVLMALSAETDGIQLFLYDYGNANQTHNVMVLQNSKTIGDMIQLYQGKSDFAGWGIFANFGDIINGTGSFSGNFLEFRVANIHKFSVNWNGHVDIESIETSGVAYLNIVNYPSAASSSVDGIDMNMGVGGHGYTGRFIQCAVNTNVVKFYVESTGHVVVGSLETGAGAMLRLYNGPLASTELDGIHVHFDKGAGAYTGAFMTCVLDSTGTALPTRTAFAIDNEGDIAIDSFTASANAMIAVGNMSPGACAVPGLFMNFGLGAGVYTGKFVVSELNNVVKFWVDYTGHIYIHSTEVAANPIIGVYGDIGGASSVDVLNVNMSVGSGAYTGYFLSFKVNSVPKFSVRATGHLEISSAETSGNGIWMGAASGFVGDFMSFQIGAEGFSRFAVSYQGCIGIITPAASGTIINAYGSAVSAATGILINMVAGYTGIFFELAVNGVPKFVINNLGVVQPSGYNSSDATPGITETVTLASTTTLIFKDGLYVGKT